MQTIATVLFFLSAIFLVVGLIKPALVLRSNDPTRGKVAKLYGAVFVLSIFAGVATDPNRTEPTIAKSEPEAVKAEEAIDYEYADMTLAEYMEESKSDRKDIALEFVEAYSLGDTAAAPFHACLSHMARNKLKTLTVGEVMQWCLTDYKNDPASLAASFIDYDAFEEQFSAWDGSHYQLNAYVKKQMNDPDSYQHIETNYRIFLNEGDHHAMIGTAFRGKNAFGGYVNHTVVAKTNLYTGAVISIIQQQ